MLRHYLRALEKWPADVLRPEVSFQKAMQRRVNRRLGVTEQTSADKETVNTIVDNGNLKAEMEEANALFTFLENRYTKKVLSDVIFYKTAQR